MILITGKIRFKEQVQKALGQAPERFREGILGGLLTERDMFVGSKKRDGIYTKKIMRKVSLRGEHWPRSIARIFGGRVDNAARLNGMKLIMGVGESQRAKQRNPTGYGVGIYSGIPFRDVLDFLNFGGSIAPRESEFMVVPVYRNFSDKKTIHKQWLRMREDKSLEMVREGNRIYYFRKNGTGDDRDLLFIGIKHATIKRQYNFQGDWERRLPSVYTRLQKRVDKIVDRIDHGRLY